MQQWEIALFPSHTTRTPQRQIRWYRAHSVKCTAAPTSREHTQRSRLSEHTHAQRDQLAAVRILLSAALRSFAHVCTLIPTMHPHPHQPKVQFQRYVVAEPHRTPRARYNVAHTLGDIIFRLDGVVRGPNMFFFPLLLSLHTQPAGLSPYFFVLFLRRAFFAGKASHTRLHSLAE